MKVQEIMHEVLAEIKDEQKDAAKEILKERVVEIQLLKSCLDNAEKQLNELLKKDIIDVITLP